MSRLLNFFDKYLFLLFLFFIFFFEGIGYIYNTKTSYYLTVIMPFFLFSIDVFKNKKTIVSKRIFILFVLVLVFSFISVLFSTDIPNSFENLLFLMSIFLTFVYVVNHKSEILGRIEKLLIFLGTIYVVFFLLTDRFGIALTTNFRNFVKFVPRSAHNNLGDYLGLVLLIILQKWLINRKKWYLIPFMFFFYFFIFSFSRTAYLSFLIVGSILLFRNINKFKTKVLLILPLLFICLFLFFTLTKEAKTTGWSPVFYRFLENKFDYKDKTFVSGRNYYFNWAIHAVIAKPLTGVGLGNYTNASTKFSQIPLSVSVSSKNIFLDYFSEGGIFVGIIFIVIILYILPRCGFSPLILYLFLSFQTYWLHRFYSIFLLFFTLLAIHLKEKEESVISIGSGKMVMVSLFILIISLLLLSSSVFTDMSKYKTAFLLYPLNQRAVFGLAQQELNNGHKAQALRYINWSVKLTPGCSSCLNIAGNLYLKIGDKQKALQIFLQAYSWNPYTTENYSYVFPLGQKLIIRKIYELEKQLYGEGKAKQFFDSYMHILQKSIPNEFSGSSLVYDDAKVMCYTIYQNERCPYKF